MSDAICITSTLTPDTDPLFTNYGLQDSVFLNFSLAGDLP
jgi:hypothetical protein